VVAGRIAVWLTVATTAATFTAGFAGSAGAATTSFDSTRTILLDGRPAFPIVLSPGPPVGSTTPWGTNGLAETASAGVDMFRVGPGGTWSSADIASALAFDRAAAALHVNTWTNLSGYSRALPRSADDTALAQIVNTLTSDPSGSAIGMWRGRDEPWWSNILPSALEFPYCRVTSRGDPSWCDGENPLDPGHLWVTIEAPRGTASDLAPYSAVTDVHGVDIYPVTIAQPSPDLHRVGEWTATLDSITPGAPVWTTLQICSGASYDLTTHEFVLPTFEQERYMAYDAIVNGTRVLAFFGGNVAGCWSSTDAQHGWNWTFWQSVLKPLVNELSASSAIEPALLNAATSRHVATTDGTTEAVVREGTSVDDLWLIAARSGTGSAQVTISGLPQWTRTGSVYTESRTVTAAGGSLRDSFGQWDVHVYHFVEPLALAKPKPSRATVGSRVTLQGRGLAAATAVSFGAVRAHFTIRSDRKLVVTVPRRARSGPVVVASALARIESKSSFAILPSPRARPRIIGAPRVGHILKATTGTWYGDPPTGFKFRWLGCNAAGRACKQVKGARKRTMWLGHRRMGRRFRVLVIERTASGSARALSAQTAVIARPLR
jgi:hypothetical protein